jgi:hypothetical protein
LHGLPRTIVSDRGPSFASNFWKEFLVLLGIERNLSTAFHPQSDGQTERVNQVLETYLRLYVNYNQDNWAEMLDMAEFCYNNTWHSATQCTPFFSNIGRNPNFHIATTPIESAKNPAVKEGVERIHAIQTELTEHLQHAAAEMKKYADRHRLDPEPFEVGSRVFLSSENIKTIRPSNKLDFKHFGPYTILQRIGQLCYQLDLPKDMKIHNVFHVNLLTRERMNTFEGRHIDPPPAIITDMEAHYEVEEIHAMKVNRGRIFYLVKWLGYDIQHNQWVKEEDVADCQEIVNEFINKNRTRVSGVINEQSTFLERRAAPKKGTPYTRPPATRTPKSSTPANWNRRRRKE